MNNKKDFMIEFEKLKKVNKKTNNYKLHELTVKSLLKNKTIRYIKTDKLNLSPDKWEIKIIKKTD